MHYLLAPDDDAVVCVQPSIESNVVSNRTRTLAVLPHTGKVYNRTAHHACVFDNPVTPGEQLQTGIKGDFVKKPYEESENAKTPRRVISNTCFGVTRLLRQDDRAIASIFNGLGLS